MEFLRSLCLSDEIPGTQKRIFDLNTALANVNRMVAETNTISKTTVAQLDALENILRKYLNTEQILVLEEKRMQQRREFDLLQFLSLQHDVWISKENFSNDIEEIEKILKLKSTLVNLFYLCFEEIQWTLENLAFPELGIMDAWYECISLFKAYKRNVNVNLGKIPFYYSLRETKYEPIIEQKHERHIACLYRLLLEGRALVSSPLIAKQTSRITKEDCWEIKQLYTDIVKERRDASMLRTLCYEEIKGKRASENIKLFKEIHEVEV